MKAEIKPLTGLRGAAALIVASYHFGRPVGEPRGTGWFELPKGYLAVDAFFILSAFVLSYNYLPLLSQGMSAKTWSDFFVRRLARLYPAYYGILALAIAKRLLTDPHQVAELSLVDWLGNLAMATGWGPTFHTLVGTSWSASVEIVCYVCFPYLARGIRFSNAIALLTLAVAFAGLAFYAQDAGGFDGALDMPRAAAGLFPLLRGACDFAIGLIVFKAYEILGKQTSWSSDVILLSMVGLLTVSIVIDCDLLAIVGLAGLVFALACCGRLAQILFANRPIILIGHISYSLYLFHPLLAGSLYRYHKHATDGSTASHWVTFVLYILLCFAVSSVFYVIFEKRGKAVVLRAYASACSGLPWSWRTA